MKTIPLTQGKVAMVDDEDYPVVSRFAWQYAGNGYAITGSLGPKIYLHRLVYGRKNGKTEIDHINGDRLDNRKQNLRLATRAENSYNLPKRAAVSSRYKGVSWCKSRKKWKATIQRTALGRFITEEDAARAYDRAAVEKFGEFARLNFPVI